MGVEEADLETVGLYTPTVRLLRRPGQVGRTLCREGVVGCDLLRVGKLEGSILLRDCTGTQERTLQKRNFQIDSADLSSGFIHEQTQFAPYYQISE